MVLSPFSRYCTTSRHETSTKSWKYFIKCEQRKERETEGNITKAGPTTAHPTSHHRRVIGACVRKRVRGTSSQKAIVIGGKALNFGLLAFQRGWPVFDCEKVSVLALDNDGKEAAQDEAQPALSMWKWIEV